MLDSDNRQGEDGKANMCQGHELGYWEDSRIHCSRMSGAPENKGVPDFTVEGSVLYMPTEKWGNKLKQATLSTYQGHHL